MANHETEPKEPSVSQKTQQTITARQVRVAPRTPEERRSMCEWLDSIMEPRRRARRRENRKTRRPKPRIANEPIY